MPDSRYIVALSGGPDSCALLLALCELADDYRLEYPSVGAHFHHGLRGDDADREAAFCAALCLKLKIPCLIEVAQVDIAGHSPQAAARTARYRFLQDVAGKHDAENIAVGHHADDIAETVLLRVLRGTSVDGLTGIPAKRALSPQLTLIRPLLTVTRREIESYCADRDIVPNRDPSNNNERYTRSRLRDRMTAIAMDFNPNLSAALSRLATLAADDSALLQTLADQWRKRTIRIHLPGYIELSQILADAPIALRRRVILSALRDVLRNQTDGDDFDSEAHAELETWENVAAIDTLLCAKRGAIDLPGNLRAEASIECLTIFQPVEWLPNTPYHYDLPIGENVYVSEAACRFILCWETGTVGEKHTVRSPTVVFGGTIAENLRDGICSLAVRTLKRGDRITPLGMSGSHKKATDSMADAGWSAQIRATAPLVVRTDTDEPLWIVGLLQDESTRVLPDDTEKPFLRITMRLDT